MSGELRLDDHLGEIRDETGYTVPGGTADERSELFAPVVPGLSS